MTFEAEILTVFKPQNRTLKESKYSLDKGPKANKSDLCNEDGI